MYDQDTRATDWIEADSAGTTNNTALTTSAAKAPTTTKPETNAAAGRFVFDLRAQAGADGAGIAEMAKAVHYDMAFALQDANNKTIGYRVWQWRPVGDTWLPRLLLEGVATAGARTGVSGGDLDDSWFLADTITATTDNTRGQSAQVDTDTDGLAVLSFDGDGSGAIEVELSRNGQTATAGRVMLAAK